MDIPGPAGLEKGETKRREKCISCLRSQVISITHTPRTSGEAALRIGSHSAHTFLIRRTRVAAHGRQAKALRSMSSACASSGGRGAKERCTVWRAGSRPPAHLVQSFFAASVALARARVHVPTSIQPSRVCAWLRLRRCPIFRGGGWEGALVEQRNDALLREE